MLRIRRWTFRPVDFLFVPVLLAGVAVLSGCENVNRLREAQAAWNDAASQENAVRLEGFITERAAYASAMESLNLLFDDDDSVRRLNEDRLLGVAYSLKALTHWKLEQFEDAKSARNMALETDDQLFPRDMALMTALDGLIANDQMFALRESGMGDKFDFRDCGAADSRTLCRHFALYDRTISFLEAGGEKVGPNHPLQIYLVQSALVAYRNLRQGVKAFSVSPLDAINPKTGVKIQMAAVVILSRGRRACETINRLGDLKQLVDGSDPKQSARIVDEYVRLVGLQASDDPITTCDQKELTVPITPVES